MRSQRHQARGGGKLGKLPWQSSRTIKGLKLISPIAADGVQLEELVADEICKEAKGVALMLLTSWSSIKDIEALEPLVVLFPGHCESTLKKIGASEGRINQIEIVVQEPQTQQLPRRNATSLALSSHQFQFGHCLQSVSWGPEASCEYILELDTRWTSELIVQCTTGLASSTQRSGRKDVRLFGRGGWFLCPQKIPATTDDLDGQN